MNNVKNKIKRQFVGAIVSDKMNKTIIVKVERFIVHPKYKKRYKIIRKYKVHDERNECNIGDKVLFEECRPISKEKRWRVVKKLLAKNKPE